MGPTWGATVENVTRRKRVDHEDDERVSLAPLAPEEALRALLAVRPGDEAEPEPNRHDEAAGDAGDAHD